MTKQISPKVSCVIMFIYIERSVFTPSLPALLWPSRLTEIFTSSHMPCQTSFPSYHSDLKKKKGSYYPCLFKTYQNSHCILNKIQIPLRSHFLSCLSQSLFSNVTDQLSVPTKHLCFWAFAFLRPAAWGSLFPEFDQANSF